MGPALAATTNAHFLSPLSAATQGLSPVLPRPPVCPGETAPKVLFVTPELAPLTAVGGLGEVAAALPRALMGRLDVRLLVPGYRAMREAWPTMEIVAHLPGLCDVPPCSIGQVVLGDGLVVFVVLCAELFDRPGTPYADASGREFTDSDLRFARLGLAAAALAAGAGGLGWRPDLIHAHDWPAALSGAYAAWQGSQVPSILTIHNLAYQGLFGRDRLSALGIPEQAFGVDGVEFFGQLSFLKAGIVHAAQITTVSATYAREITTPAFGCGLDGLLRLRAEQGRLVGILNGIDESWDPRNDPHLASHFATDHYWGKHVNAGNVRAAFNLAVSRGPLFSVVARLVHQKGIDLAIEATETIVRAGGQIVVTGRGEKKFEDALMRLAAKHPGAVGVKIGFDERVARRIFAGSDFFLMPSRFEPCGLSQMYAQKFGTLPIAHATGGLLDTIEDGETGFLFRDLSIKSLLGAVTRALDTFQSRQKFTDMKRAAMARASAWGDSAQDYAALYRSTTVAQAT